MAEPGEKKTVAEGDAGRRGRLMTSATVAAVAVAGVLLVIKFLAWRFSGAVVILSSLIDSALDALASLVNFVAVRQALTPADKEHRFGHGKAEALAGLAQSTIIAASALYIFYEAVRHLVAPEPVARGGLAIGVMVASMVLTLGLVGYQRFVIRQTGSVAISADSLHYKGDLLMNGSVILALVLSTYFGVTWADPVFAIGIGLYILVSSGRIFLASMDIVLDRELPDDARRNIMERVTMHPEIIGMHDLKTRSTGTDLFIQFHIELDPSMTVARAHEIMDDVEKDIRRDFPDAEIIIHTDPYGIAEPRNVYR